MELFFFKNLVEYFEIDILLVRLIMLLLIRYGRDIKDYFCVDFGSD